MNFKTTTFLLLLTGILSGLQAQEISTPGENALVAISENDRREKLELYVEQALRNGLELEFHEVEISSEGKITAIGLRYFRKATGESGKFTWKDPEGIGSILLIPGPEGSLSFVTTEDPRDARFSPQPNEKHQDRKLIIQDRTSRYVSTPLVILDGVIQEKGFDLHSIDHEKIRSIHVLKEPAAVKKYGEKAAGGAIAIRTKEAPEHEQ